MVLPVAASLLGLAALRLLGPDYVSQEQLTEWLAPLGVWAPVVFLAFLVVRPITLLPGQLFAAVGGMVFGFWWGLILSLVGSLLSSVVVHALARRHGTRAMKRWAGPRYDALRTSARKHDFVFNFASCINPLAPTDVMLALSASSGARLWPSALGVLVGSIPGTLLTVVYGMAVGRGQGVVMVVSGVGLVLSLVLGLWVARQVMREQALFQRQSPRTGPQAEGSEAPPGSASGSAESPRVSPRTTSSTASGLNLSPPRVT
ncbi:MAG TPA: VTT domain-containing protein [Myxococcaceae bacterium]|nr:VTT domain-containing protein [Myxococcaceae bacterium]